MTARIRTLAGALGSLIAMAIKRQVLMDAAAEKERLEHDLSIARQIQMQLLPKTNPKVEGFDIAGWNKPADETGGDCYGFLPLSEGQGSVSDRGRLGAWNRAGAGGDQCRAMIRAVADQGENLSLIAARVNRLLCQDLPAGRFVTACFGILDARERRLGLCERRARAFAALPGDKRTGEELRRDGLADGDFGRRGISASGANRP